MFELNPLNLPNAPIQHIIMMVVAGALGFIIGYIGQRQTARRLNGELATLVREVDECHRASEAAENLTTNIGETAVLDRIRSRANEIDLERIGFATAEESDDLKQIAGIGPFLEKKLHAIGIYNFHQIANLTKEDVNKVNEIIEFFPGRIERDNWVGQATEFVKRT